MPPHHKLKSPKSWFDVFLASGGGLSFIAGVVLLGLTYVSANAYLEAHRLNTQGAFVQANVVDRRVRRNDEGPDKYYLTIRYVIEGRHFSDEAKVGSQSYNASPVGSDVRIGYWTEDPELYEVKIGSTREKAVHMQLFALLAGLIACGVLWFNGRKAAAGILARRWGQRTTAEVTGWVERKHSGRPTGKGYMVFVTQDGQRSESLDHPIRTFQAIGVGGQINVYVRKGDIWWEGDVGPRVLPRSSVPKVTG